MPSKMCVWIVPPSGSGGGGGVTIRQVYPARPTLISVEFEEESRTAEPLKGDGRQETDVRQPKIGWIGCCCCADALAASRRQPHTRRMPRLMRISTAPGSILIPRRDMWSRENEADMAKWTFEPGHTAAEFCARHMMVTCVRGHFKNVHGTLEFDPADPTSASVEATIDARRLWSGEPDRDAHLKSADFLAVENHPTITFRGKGGELVGPNDGRMRGELTIRGITRPVTLDVRFLGQWQTPWWEDGVDKGPKTRAGFVATTR